VIITMVVTGPVGSSVVGITPSIGGITPSVVTSVISTPTIPGIIITAIAPAVGRIISAIVGIPEGESETPSRISPTDIDPPVNGTSGIEIKVGIVWVIIAPTIIFVRKAPQVGGVVIVIGIRVIIIHNDRWTGFSVLTHLINGIV
jgi:hypothetical protein